MPTIECLITRDEKLLLVRDADGALLPLRARVAAGEAPIEACVHQARRLTGLTLTPSCVALIFDESPETAADYRLVFVAAAPGATAAGDFEWLTLEELDRQTDVPALERELIPRLLMADGPLAVVVDVDASTQPPVQRLQAVTAIDPARISPLIFAISP